jgi:hypothetical protein
MDPREFRLPETAGPWRQIADRATGADELILYKDENSGTYSRLIRMQPGFIGATTSLKHEFNEVVYIIQGGFIDKVTGKAYPAGHFAYFPAGTEHGPLAAPVGVFGIEFRHFPKR